MVADRQRQGRLAGLALAIGIMVGGVPALLVAHTWRTSSVWLLALAAMALALAAGGSLAGAHRLVEDERGRWSLSRAQSLVWLWLLVPTYWTIAMSRLLADVADPLTVGMDENLWALLGISAASLVASPLILARKQATAPGLVDTPRELGRTTPGWRDLVRGEDTGNSDVVDLGRLQLIVFTAVAVALYFASCWHTLAAVAPPELAFPALSRDLVTLLGISHAAYLANKNVDRIDPLSLMRRRAHVNTASRVVGQVAAPRKLRVELRPNAGMINRFYAFLDGKRVIASDGNGAKYEGLVVGDQVQLKVRVWGIGDAQYQLSIDLPGTADDQGLQLALSEGYHELELAL